MSKGDGGPKGREGADSNTSARRRGGAAPKGERERKTPLRFAALDLGTNNCRLLIAAPSRDNFRIVDSFSRIVRLGEDLSRTGVLSDGAMDRTMDAIKVCAEKVARRGVTHIRCIATQACRGAENGKEFLLRVRRDTGLKFDIITPEEEARLSVSGCAELVDPAAPAGLIFDIGGGSTELSWVKRMEKTGALDVVAWTSFSFGVVSVAEKWGGAEISLETFDEIVREIRSGIAAFGDPAMVKPIFERGEAHLLGTSGTVTSIAGVHLKLPRYKRAAVDGLWLSLEEARAATEKLRAQSYEERCAEPCIGKERADLVVAGCAILEALVQEWPTSRIRVADRGLREGILMDLMAQARGE